MSYELIRANALNLPLADNSVDLCITSPPYFALRAYQDQGEVYDGQIGSEATPQAFLEALWAVTAECRRVLKPSGSMFVNLGDKYSATHTGTQGATGDRASRSEAKAKVRRLTTNTGGIPAKSLMGLPWRYAIGCIDQLGLILRAEIIWSKPNGLPESVTDRVRRSHETWFHFTKEPRYFSAVDEVREESRPPTGTALRFADAGGTTGFKTNGNRGDEGRGNFVPSPLGKLPGSVWTIPTEPLRVPDHLGVDHFAAFASEWPRRIILGWSPSGVCVACGFLLGSSYDNGMHGVRGADRRGPVQDDVGPDSGHQEQPLLREGVLGPVHGTQPCVDEVPPADDQGLRGDLEAGSPDGAEVGLHDGAPLRDVGAPRPTAGASGDRPPSQRGQDGQPDREPRADGQDGARPSAEAGPEAVSVPPLRRAHPDVRQLEPCPNCGGGDFREPVVLDVFCGTGTVPAVAHALGRHGIGIDLSADYLRLAEWRCNDTALRAKVLGVDKPKPVPNGQLDMFGDVA